MKTKKFNKLVSTYRIPQDVADMVQMLSKDSCCSVYTANYLFMDGNQVTLSCPVGVLNVEFTHNTQRNQYAFSMIREFVRIYKTYKEQENGQHNQSIPD